MSHEPRTPRPHGVSTDNEELAAEFHAIRPRLVGVAYALLGSVDEAEDTVQDAWLRLARSDPAQIRDITGWLVVTVSRLALDTLRSARKRREEYVGPWLPEPVVTDGDPLERVTLDESMSMAMLVVLETLSPAERTSFVLHDVFGLPFTEVGAVVGRSPASCRQLAARARKHAAERAPRFEVDAAEHRRVVDAFARAAIGADPDTLVALLDPDAVLRTDGGGTTKAALRPIHGAEKIARLVVGLITREKAVDRLRPTTVNGRPGLLGFRDGALNSVVALTVADGRITGIDAVVAPEKLRRIG